MRRRNLLGLIFGMCLVLSFTVMNTGGVATGAEITLKVGTGPVGGNWFPLGAVVSTIINEKVEGVRAAPTLGGGKTNLIALNKGTQDFSLTIATTNAWGWNGEPPPAPCTPRASTRHQAVVRTPCIIIGLLE